MNIAKKALSSVVVSTTILWSMGASMLVGTLTANAAPADGSLIKAKEIEAVYYYKGGKRWTFPNLKTFKSWFKDFSSVKSVTLAELQTYQLTGNVVYRPGTRLIKITTDPKVYAVEPGGKLRPIKDEATAKALWGANWAKAVDDVSDAFFTNYTVGADLSTATFPDGALLSSGGNYFYIQGGKSRAVSASALASNGFNTAYAVAADVSALAAGAAVAEGEFSDVAQGATAAAAPGPVASSGSLAISIASDSPATGSAVVNNTANAPGQRQAKVLKVNFTATGGDTVVTQVSVKRMGVSKDGDVDNLYLADANGKIIAKNTSLSNGVATFASAGLFTVAAGQTAGVWLLEDFNHSAAAGSTQSWMVEAAGVKLAGTGAATGSATGSVFTVANVSDLADLEMATSSPVSGSPTVDAGKMGYTLGTFKFKAVNQDTIVKSIKFTQIGTVAATDLANFKLQVGGIQYDGVKASMTGGTTLWFDLTKDSTGAANADGGLKLLAGQTKFTDLIGDVVGGTNRTYAFSVQNQEDVVAFDNAYKVNVPVFAGVGYTGTVFAVQTLVSTTVNVGTLTVSQATDAPSGNVAINGSSVSLAKLGLQANGEDVKLTTLSVTSTASVWSMTFKNVKVLLDGQQVGTTVTSLVAGNAATFTFSNNFIIHVGKPSVLDIQADLTDSSIQSNRTFALSLVAGSANGQGVTSLTSINSTAISGNTLTAKTGAPSVTKNTSVVDATATDPTGVVNGRGAIIGSFIIQSGDGEGSKITSIQLADNTVALSGLFSRLRLVDGAGATLAPEVGTLSGSGATYNFNLTTPMTLQKGEQRVVNAIVDVLSTTSSAAINTAAVTLKVAQNGVNYQTLTTGQSGTAPTSAALALQANYLAGSGSVTVANSADTPTAQQFVMGSLAQPIFKFKLTAGRSEDVSVTDIATAATILATATPPTGIIKNLRLYEGDTAIGQAVASLTSSDASATVAGATSTAYAKFSSLSINIPRNTSKTYTVVADIAAGPDIYSNENFTMHVVNGYDTGGSSAVIAKGGSSGVTITPAGNIGGFQNSTPVRGSMMTVFRTKISVAHAANAPSGAASAAAEQSVAKFVISNTANVNNAAATINLLNVDIATSISMAGAASRLLKIYKTETLSSDNQLASSNVNAAVGAGMVCTPGNAAGTYASANCPAFKFSDFNSGNGVVIEAGSSQIFTVTMNTSDATSAKTLTVGIPGSLIALPATSAGGYIQWSDGYTSTINGVNTLPLIGKTLTY